MWELQTRTRYFSCLQELHENIAVTIVRSKKESLWEIIGEHVTRWSQISDLG